MTHLGLNACIPHEGNEWGSVLDIAVDFAVFVLLNSSIFEHAERNLCRVQIQILYTRSWFEHWDPRIAHDLVVYLNSHNV